MAHLICPSRTELDSLRTPLTAGELRVLEFFDRYLPEGWEIYIQPHLNGLRPDFVLLHPQIGIAVFEVKDWHLEAMPYFVREINGVPSLWSRDKHGQEFRHRDNPVEKVVWYKQKILDLYCPKLGLLVKKQAYALSVITAGVIMTETNTARATELFQPFLKHFGWLNDKAKKYHPVVGQDALANHAPLAAGAGTGCGRCLRPSSVQFGQQLTQYHLGRYYPAGRYPQNGYVLS